MVAFLGFRFWLSTALGASEQAWVDYNPGWNTFEKTRFILDVGVRRQIQ